MCDIIGEERGGAIASGNHSVNGRRLAGSNARETATDSPAVTVPELEPLNRSTSSRAQRTSCTMDIA